MPAFGLEPDAASFKLTMATCARAAQWQQVLLLHDQLLRASCPPSAGTYDALIAACKLGGQWERALAVVRDMQDQGLPPETIPYSLVLKLCKAGQQWQSALGVLRERWEDGLPPEARRCFRERSPDGTDAVQRLAHRRIEGTVAHLTCRTAPSAEA